MKRRSPTNITAYKNLNSDLMNTWILPDTERWRRIIQYFFPVQNKKSRFVSRNTENFVQVLWYILRKCPVCEMLSVKNSCAMKQDIL